MISPSGFGQQLCDGRDYAIGLHSYFTKDSISKIDILATPIVFDARKIPFSGKTQDIFVSNHNTNIRGWRILLIMIEFLINFQGCGYSIWHLEGAMRKNWLTSVLVIAYKYNCSPDTNPIIADKMVRIKV